MFDYPLPIPRDTHYQRLGISADATADEVREATAELGHEFQQRKTEVDRRVKDIYDRVPGLHEADEELTILRSQRAEGKQVEPLTWTVSVKKVAELEATARQLVPNFRELQQQSADLESQIRGLNSLAWGLWNSVWRTIALTLPSNCSSWPIVPAIGSPTPAITVYPWGCGGRSWNSSWQSSGEMSFTRVT